MKDKKVLCGGVFNIIHPGHCYFLESARKLGDELVVVVAHDSTVKRNKKKLLFPSSVRSSLVNALACVDRVVIGDEKDMMKIVRKEKPDVIAIGYDQDMNGVMSALKREGIECEVVRLKELSGYSTRGITGG